MVDHVTIATALLLVNLLLTLATEYLGLCDELAVRADEGGADLGIKAEFVVVVLTDGALNDAGYVVPFVTYLANSQLLSNLSVVYEVFLLAALDNLMDFRQNDLSSLISCIPL